MSAGSFFFLKNKLLYADGWTMRTRDDLYNDEVEPYGYFLSVAPGVCIGITFIIQRF